MPVLNTHPYQKTAFEAIFSLLNESVDICELSWEKVDKYSGLFIV